MKKLSRLLAVVLAVLMLATAFVGCHEKDEIAFTIGESKFTSAMYSCALFLAAKDARADIDTFLSENSFQLDNVDYSSYKFDEEGNVSTTGTVSYNKYVRNEAINTLKWFAVVDSWMAAKGLELDDDAVLAAQYDASYYWNVGCDYSTYYYYTTYYGMDPSSAGAVPYMYYLEQNGVAYSTYEEYILHQQKYNFYFEYMYGEGGEKEIAKGDLTSYMNEHYVLADYITFSKTDSEGTALSNDKITELKALADGYAERLNAGEDFADIYEEENARLEAESEEENDTSSNTTTSGDASSDTASSEDTSSDTTSSGTEEDKYSPSGYTNIFGDEESGYNSAMFSEYAKQEIGKAVVLEDTANSQYVLFVRRDMMDESYEDYWFDYLELSVRYLMKQDEYDAALDEAGNALKLTEDTHATSPFGVEDIKFEIEE